MTPLLRKTMQLIARELRKRGHPISETTTYLAIFKKGTRESTILMPTPVCEIFIDTALNRVLVASTWLTTHNTYNPRVVFPVYLSDPNFFKLIWANIRKCKNHTRDSARKARQNRRRMV